MHIDDKNDGYMKYFHAWMRGRDFIEGSDAVKAQKEKYLPRLGSHKPTLAGENTSILGISDTPYEQYLRRATFLNATGKTRDALVGMLTRKGIEVVFPEAAMPVLEVIGSNLDDFEDLSMKVLDEAIGIGRCGIMVDVAEGREDFPLAAIYHAEAITNWSEILVDGSRVTGSVTLQEPHIKGASGNELRVFRRLVLGDPTAEDGGNYEDAAALTGAELTAPIYFVELWVENESNKKGDNGFSRVDLTVPRKRGGDVMRRIPFVFVNSMSTKATPSKPALLDITVLNEAHYRNSADYEHGLHFTALPQPYAAGFQFNGDVAIGAGQIWSSEDPNAKANYLEFTGAGLGQIEKAMGEKVLQMAALGASFLEDVRGGAKETAESVRHRASGNHSALSRIGENLSSALTDVLVHVASFLNLDTDGINVSLTDDFTAKPVDANTLKALLEAVLSGTMSWQSYFAALERGEVYPDEWDMDKEAEAIAEGLPSQAGLFTEEQGE